MALGKAHYEFVHVETAIESSPGQHDTLRHIFQFTQGLYLPLASPACKQRDKGLEQPFSSTSARGSTPRHHSDSSFRLCKEFYQEITISVSPAMNHIRWNQRLFHHSVYPSLARLPWSLDQLFLTFTQRRRYTFCWKNASISFLARVAVSFRACPCLPTSIPF